MSEVTQPTAEGVVLPDDFGAYKAARLGVAVPPVEQPEPVAEVTEDQPSPEATEEEAESAPDSETGEQDTTEEQEESADRDDKGRFKAKDLPPGAQKRIQKEIDRAVAARKAAEAELERIRSLAATQGTDPVKTPQQPAEQTAATFDKPAPKIDDYTDLDSYLVAFAEYSREAARFEAKHLVEAEREAQRKSAEQSEAAKRQESAKERWSALSAEARKQFADFDEVLDDAGNIPDGPGQQAIALALAESPKAAHLAYWLAKNSEQANRIARLSPVSAAMELGKIEAALSNPAQKTQKPKVSTAPEPPRQKVDGAPKPSPNLDDFATYKRVRAEQEAARRTRRF